MVKVKLQKRQGLRGKYYTYVVTLPKSIVESMPKLQEARFVEMILRKEELILKHVRG